MRNRLESIRPLDANVEKDGAKEIGYDDNDSYFYLFDAGEGDIEPIDDDDKAILDAIREDRSELLEELWSGSDLGKYTIGVPTQEKQAAQNQEQYMQPVSELEFQDIAEDADPEDKKKQEEFERIMKQLEEEMGF